MSTTVLLDPRRFGGGGADVSQTIVSQLQSLDVAPIDTRALTAWLSANYRPGMAWAVLAKRSTKATLGLAGTAEGESVHVWWGDGTTATAAVPHLGSGLPLTVFSRDYPDSTRLGIVVLGDVTYIASNYSIGGQALDLRASLLPRTLRSLTLNPSGRLDGLIQDLPPEMTRLWVYSGLGGHAEDLPRNLTILGIQGSSPVQGSLSDLPPTLEQLVLFGSAAFAGTLADLPRTLTYLSADGSALSVTGDLVDLPPAMTRLSLDFSAPITGDVADAPRTLTYFRLGGFVTGDVADLPPGLTYLMLQGENTLSGSFADMPATLTMLSLSGEATVTGTAADLPDGLTSLDLAGNTLLSGDVADLPDTITRLVISGAGGHTIGGDVSGLPASLDYGYLAGANTISGDVSDIPGTPRDLSFYGNNTVTGDLDSLPEGLDAISLRGFNTVTGDLSDLPSTLTDIDWIKSGTPNVTLSTASLPAGLSRAYLDGVLADTPDVDNLLAALWANRDAPKPRSQRSITVRFSPGPTTETVADQLRAYRSPGNDPQYPLWSISLPPAVGTGPGDPVELDVEIVHAAKSNLPRGNNRTVHTASYDFESTTQDGTVVLLIMFMVDTTSGQTVTKDAAVTEILPIQTTAANTGAIHWGYYVPSQGDLDTGSKEFTYGSNPTQGSQFFFYELRNVDVADISGAVYEDIVNSLRTSLGGGSILAEEGDLIIIGTTTHGNYGGTFVMSPTQGFTMDLEDPRTSGSAVGYLTASSKAVTSSGSQTLPSYTLQAVGDNRTQAQAIVVQPATGEGGGDPPPDQGDVTAMSDVNATFETTQSITKALPTALAGDTILAAVMHRSPLTAPSGWTLVATQAVSGSTFGQVLSLYSRIRESWDPPSYTWSQAENGRLGVGYLVLRGSEGAVTLADRASDAMYSEAGPDTPHPLPSVTVGKDGSRVVAVVSDGYTGGTGGTWTAPSGWTLHVGAGLPDNRLAILSRPADAGVVSGVVVPHAIGDAGVRHATAEIVVVAEPGIGTVPTEVFIAVQAEELL